MSVETKKYTDVGEERESEGYSLDPLSGVEERDVLLGGKKLVNI